MKRRFGLLAALAFAALSACSAPSPRSEGRGACEVLFIEYDRLERFSLSGMARVGTPGLPSRRTQVEVLLVRNDCLTRETDLAGLEAAVAARAGRGIAEGGAALPRPVVLHLGAVTSGAGAARSVAAIESLGLRATSVGAPRLGRRVYAGPILTEDGLADVIGFAGEAGFRTPYVSETFRF